MIAVGVDTHKERHYAVALDQLGQMLAELIVRGDGGRLSRSCSDWAEAARRRGESSSSGSRAPAAGAPACCQHLQHAGHSRRRGRASAPKDRRAGQVRPHRRARRRQARAQRRERLDPAPPRDSHRHPGAADRAALRGRRTHPRPQPAPGAERDRAGRAARTRSARAPASSSSGEILSMRARANASLEERVAFAVMRDLAAHSRALGADAKRYQDRARRAGPIARRDAARRARDRTDLRRQAARLRPDPLQERGRLRALQRHRTDTRLIGQDRPLPTQPRRRPPSQQRHPHDRDHPRQTPARNPRLPRPPHPRGQDQTRSAPITQAPHLPRALPPPHRHPLDFIEASLTFGDKPAMPASCGCDLEAPQSSQRQIRRDTGAANLSPEQFRDSLSPARSRDGRRRDDRSMVGTAGRSRSRPRARPPSTTAGGSSSSRSVNLRSQNSTPLSPTRPPNNRHSIAPAEYTNKICTPIARGTTHPLR